MRVVCYWFKGCETPGWNRVVLKILLELYFFWTRVKSINSRFKSQSPESHSANETILLYYNSHRCTQLSFTNMHENLVWIWREGTSLSGCVHVLPAVSLWKNSKPSWACFCSRWADGISTGAAATSRLLSYGTNLHSSWLTNEDMEHNHLVQQWRRQHNELSLIMVYGWDVYSVYSVHLHRL